MKKLNNNFFRQGALEVARALVGKVIVRRHAGEIIKGRIIETEAYIGEQDKACHARFGKTQRNAVMYEAGGYIYVYLCYGIHHLLNIVTGEKEHPEAVLIRKILTPEGDELGPGSLTKYLKVDRTCSGVTVGGDLFIAEDNFILCGVLTDKRVGIEYAEEYVDKPWRFIAKK